MSGATLVVGATGGIGRALTAQLLAAGQSVIAVARTPAALDALKLEHPDVEIESADAADFEALLDIAKRAQTRHGGVAGAVNLAGSLQLTPAHRTSQADWTHTITQNLTTAFALVRAAASVMLR
ncbi:MAG: SDR family NAD(P)-dependent oxidoreductase, partial [Planctomycetota bacterium]